MKNRDARDKAEAKERAKRAKDYAEMHPEFIHESDLVFQDEGWQLAQLKGFAEKVCPQKD